MQWASQPFQSGTGGSENRPPFYFAKLAYRKRKISIRLNTFELLLLTQPVPKVYSMVTLSSVVCTTFVVRRVVCASIFVFNRWGVLCKKLTRTQRIVGACLFRFFVLYFARIFAMCDRIFQAEIEINMRFGSYLAGMRCIILQEKSPTVETVV